MEKEKINDTQSVNRHRERIATVDIAADGVEIFDT